MKDEMKVYFNLCKTRPVKRSLPGPPDKPKCGLREQEEQRIKEKIQRKLYRDLDRMDHAF